MTDVNIPLTGPGGDATKAVRTVTKSGKEIQVIQLDQGAGGVESLVSTSSPLLVKLDQVTTGATSPAKAEDAAAASGDTGYAVLAVRRDVPTETTPVTNADADYSAIAVDKAGVLWARHRELITYCATYRLADATAGQLSLTFTFTANTNKQLATIYHTGSATKTVKVRRVKLIVSTGAAGVFGFEIKALNLTTAPATGNPAITPGKYDPADGAAEAACLALPTTAGSLTATNSPVSAHFEWNSAAATAIANPSGLAGQEIVLFNQADTWDNKPLIMRAGVAEGYAIVGRCTQAVALRFTAQIEFTEE